MDIFDQDLNGSGLRVGIVQSRYNKDICDGLAVNCLNELEKLGVEDQEIFHVTVPGSFEIPLALQKMAETREFDVLIALGAVIRGETYHFEVVSNECCAGISRVILDFGIPVVNAVLTTENLEQANQRYENKGKEAGRVAVEMANLVEKIEELADEDNEE